MRFYAVIAQMLWLDQAKEAENAGPGPKVITSLPTTEVRPPMTYTLEDLQAMPTIRAGPTNDLKIDTGRIRVWVRRDERTPQITVQMFEHGLWERIGSFRDRVSQPCQWLLEHRY